MLGFIFEQETDFPRSVVHVGLRGDISKGVWAQDITTTTTMKGPSMYETAVRNGMVVLVAASRAMSLSLKLSDGEVEHFIVSETQKFMVDGKPMTIGQLKPGYTPDAGSDYDQDHSVNDYNGTHDRGKGLACEPSDLRDPHTARWNEQGVQSSEGADIQRQRREGYGL